MYEIIYLFWLYYYLLYFRFSGNNEIMESVWMLGKDWKRKRSLIKYKTIAEGLKQVHNNWVQISLTQG